METTANPSRTAIRYRAAAVLAAAALGLLAGCGGGPADDEGQAAPTEAAADATVTASAEPSPSASPEPVSFAEGDAAVARSTLAPGAVFAQTLTDEEIVVYSVTIDGAVTENWRFTPKVYADHPVQDVLSSLLRQEDFTPDYRHLVVVRKERAEPIGFETRVGLHSLDGSFTDLSGYGESVPDKAVQSQPAVHHGTGRLWYWQYQNRATRLMSVGLDGEDRRHEEQIQAKMPRTVVGQPFYFPDSDVPVPTYEDGKVLVVTPDGTVGAKYVLAGAGAQIGDPYQIAEAPKFESPGYELVSWIDDETLLATGQDQIYRLTITGQRLAEQPLIAEQTPPWRRAIGQLGLDPSAERILFTTGSAEDPDVTEFHVVASTGGDPEPVALVGQGAGQFGDQLIGWAP